MNIFGENSGQALVEMLLIVIVCLMIGIGIYEGGALMHNISVMNAAVDHAATYVAWGAPLHRVERALVDETVNLLASGFLYQEFGSEGLIIEIWEPRSRQKLASTQMTEDLSPGREKIAEYMFWAQGYEARVGIRYGVGIYIPFLGSFTIPLTTISSSRVIQAPNDIDRDGMVDHYEAEYVGWAMDESGDGVWKHPVHRDGLGEFDDSSVDIDGDGIAQADTDPYDFNNDGVEDKFDPDNNLMLYNPVVGPDGFVEP
ncbi:MAG: TadE/TadG family type IV pilus assembly protein [bacterium]